MNTLFPPSNREETKYKNPYNKIENSGKFRNKFLANCMQMNTEGSSACQFSFFCLFFQVTKL